MAETSEEQEVVQCQDSVEEEEVWINRIELYMVYGLWICNRHTYRNRLVQMAETSEKREMVQCQDSVEEEEVWLNRIG
uniref:Uncharacterized protein n=1 Tax=Pinctada fucata TaxID=50426 RepID=A0A194AM08_PINFU